MLIATYWVGQKRSRYMFHCPYLQHARINLHVFFWHFGKLQRRFVLSISVYYISIRFITQSGATLAIKSTTRFFVYEMKRGHWMPLPTSLRLNNCANFRNFWNTSIPWFWCSEHVCGLHFHQLFYTSEATGWNTTTQFSLVKTKNGFLQLLTS